MTGLLLPNAARASLRVVERNARVTLRTWPLFVSGLAEPLLYLLSLGFGVGSLIGTLEVPGQGQVSYARFVAPAMLAVSALNTAVFGTTFVFFHKLHYARTFDAMASSPLEIGDIVRGELASVLTGVACYAAVFLAVLAPLGLLPSAVSLLALPGAVLIGFAFGGAGLGLATFMRSFVDFEYVHVVVTPMFLFSATFVPLSGYPGAAARLIALTPLYQGVLLERTLLSGGVTWSLLLPVGYLCAMGLAGTALAHRRVRLRLRG